MSYKWNPLSQLIDSLFSNYPYMRLHQRIIVLSALTQAVKPDRKALEKSLELIPKAIELETTLKLIESLYRKGEIDKIEIPEEAKLIYEMEIKLLKTVMQFFIKPRVEGVEKYV